MLKKQDIIMWKMNPGSFLSNIHKEKRIKQAKEAIEKFDSFLLFGIKGKKGVVIGKVSENEIVRYMGMFKYVSKSLTKAVTTEDWRWK